MEPKPAQSEASEEPILGVAPDMRLGAEDRRAPRWGDKARTGRSRRFRVSTLVGAVAALVGVASLAVSAWVYSETHREVLRLATDVAQLRISLDLYAQRSGAAAPPATSSGASSAELAELANRLAIIEQSWRSGAGAATPQTTLPAITGGSGTAASDGDCLPPGMRILVAAGDSYPICGTSGTVTVGAVDNGYVTLVDGSTVPSGGTLPLVGTNCVLGVTSGGDEGLTGYAEIRVSC
ncbi:MAG: hypothetical protein KIS86_10515 [Devosia sp.]|nr:hypothetical protein [Devosia sp.]